MVVSGEIVVLVSNLAQCGLILSLLFILLGAFDMTKLKMKKLALAAGLALAGTGMVPSAQAVNLATDGLGQVLVFPYYTTRAGWNTLINVTNTSNQVVVAKVRFHEGYNSRDVFDFNIVLSPFDVWNGTVSDSGNMPRFATSDTTCTVPAIPAGGVEFHDGVRTNGMLAYTGTAADTGPANADRMREGYITVIMMGTAPATGFPANAVHNAAGVPANCGAIRDAFALRAPTTIASLRAAFPNYAVNPLKGAFSLVNAANGWNASGEATTLANFSTVPMISAQLAPSSVANVFINSFHEPDLSSGDTQGQVLDTTNTLVTYGPATGTAGAGGAVAVSGVLGRSSIVNQWANLQASATSAWDVHADWVVTFPTKRFYADRATHEFGGNATGRPGLTGGVAPFSNIFGTPRTGQSCDDVTYTIYNREERQLISTEEPPFSPAPTPQGNALCEEVNVLTFGAAATATETNVLRSPMGAGRLAGNVGNLPGANGWMQLNFTGAATWRPVTGFAVINRTQPGGLLNEAYTVNNSYIR